MEDTAGKFFGRIVSDYDDIIRRLVSPYPEMVWALFYYLPDNYVPRRVLDLGCGTGNLTKLIRERWPSAHIVAVDMSVEMLEKTRAKVTNANVELVQSRFEELSFAPEAFELVVSSLALHHMPETVFRSFLSKSAAWLVPGGFISILDCVRARPDRLYKRAEQHWIELAKVHGITELEMAEQIEHHRHHDHYPVLIDIPQWLEAAGFKDPEILWRNSIWAVLQAQKPSCGGRAFHAPET